MTSEIAFLKIRLLPSQGKFRTRLELMAAVNTKETLKELSIENICSKNGVNKAEFGYYIF